MTAITHVLSSPSVSLLNVIALLSAVATCTWLLMVQPLRLYRYASKRFAIANATLFLYIIAYQNTSIGAFSHSGLLSHLSLFLFALLYQSGVRILFKRHLSLVGLTLVIALVCISSALPFMNAMAMPLSLAIICYMTAAIFFNGTVIKYSALKREFNTLSALMLSIPDGLFIGVLAIAGVSYSSLIFSTAESIWPLSLNMDIALWFGIGLVLLINVTAMAAAVMRLVLKMKFLAEHDQLTGLLNRRAISKTLVSLWLRLSSDNHSATKRERHLRLTKGVLKHNLSDVHKDNNFSVLMIDIDHFKQINDEFGHEAGDYALTFVAQTLSELVRETDYCARFGGEEFIVILTNTTHDTALRRAEAICDHFSKAVWREGANPITLSIGCETATHTKSIDQLLSHADDALYQAKRSGRNQIVAYSSSFS